MYVHCHMFGHPTAKSKDSNTGNPSTSPTRHTDANPFVDPGRAGGWNETTPQTKTSNNSIMNCFQHTPESCGALINPPASLADKR